MSDRFVSNLPIRLRMQQDISPYAIIQGSGLTLEQVTQFSTQLERLFELEETYTITAKARRTPRQAEQQWDITVAFESTDSVRYAWYQLTTVL